MVLLDNNNNHHHRRNIGGFSRSRALWDHVQQCKYQIQQYKNEQQTNKNQNQQQNQNQQNQNQSTILISRYDCYYEYYRALFDAILYELQPVRYNIIGEIISIVRSILLVLYNGITTTIHSKSILVPTIRSSVIPFVRHYWKYIMGIILYYYIIRYIHEAINAGPIVIIVTLLLLIFTIGLDDEMSKQDNYISAYSVFNKGFHKLMGSMDTDELVAQHVGGGMMNVMVGGALHDPNDNNDDDDDGAAVFVQQQQPNRHRIRQQQQQQQPNIFDDIDIDNRNDNNIIEEDADDDNDILVDAAAANNNNNNNNNIRQRKKKSGKKARRNHEQRVEIRRQREAARALGLDNDDYFLEDE